MTNPVVIFYGVAFGRDAGHLRFGERGVATDSEISRLPESLRKPSHIDCVWTRETSRRAGRGGSWAAQGDRRDGRERERP